MTLNQYLRRTCRSSVILAMGLAAELATERDSRTDGPPLIVDVPQTARIERRRHSQQPSVSAPRPFALSSGGVALLYDQIDDRAPVEADVVGLYPPDLAAVAAAATASDPGSGPIAMDD